MILGDGSKPYQQIVRILLAAGADPSLADKDRILPIQHARRKGHAEIAEILDRAR